MKQKNTLGYVIFMAVVAAIGGILFGYDTAVISGTTAIVKAQFGLSDAGEGWYVGCALIGSICGVLVAGTLSDYLGRKLTMLISAALFSISAIGCAVCGSFDSLVAYRIIGGVGIGIVSIVSPIYIRGITGEDPRNARIALPACRDSGIPPCISCKLGDRRWRRPRSCRKPLDKHVER